jgi:hypothetical protein
VLRRRAMIESFVIYRDGRLVVGVRHARIIIIIIMIHLLGLAPAGYLAAPDSGPRAGCGVVHAKYPYREVMQGLTDTQIKTMYGYSRSFCALV